MSKQEKYQNFQDEEVDGRNEGTQTEAALQINEKKERKLNEDEQRNYFYDSFDTFLFYSFFIIKKWFIFAILTVGGLKFNNSQEFIQKTKDFIYSKEDNWFKKTVTFIVLIPVVLILAVYAILISAILFLVGLICLIIFVLFVDLPFIIVLAIQLTLLLLLVFYTTVPSTETLAELFLESGVWYTALIWMILFIGLMLKEYDDLGNSVIYIAQHYRNKKIESRLLVWFYILFSCFPQMVQFAITSYSAWISVGLIFENSDYLGPFSHFAGLFVVLQVDSFIMEFIKVSKLYVAPSKVFTTLEDWKREEREKEKERLKRIEEERNKGMNEMNNGENKMELQKRIYTWDEIHFPTRTVLKFFGMKDESGANHFFINPKLNSGDDKEEIIQTRLFYFKYSIMVLGMAFILYNFIIYVIKVCCCC